jgi:large subunit ribosomal protein L18
MKDSRPRLARVRTKIKASASRPRLTVFRSNQHIYAQIIDDHQAKTLVAAASTQQPKKTKPKLSAAQWVGEAIATKALKHKINQVVFDRGRYHYHGRVKALAEAARQKGLKF